MISWIGNPDPIPLSLIDMMQITRGPLEREKESSPPLSSLSYLTAQGIVGRGRERGRERERENHSERVGTIERGLLRSGERMANEESGGQRGDIGRAHEACGGGEEDGY